MVLKGICAAALCALFLVSSQAMADGYRPDEFLGLDLSKAALSPIPLGPPAQFEQVPVEAKTVPDVKALPDVKVKQTVRVHVVKPHRIARTKPPVRAKLVRRHTNPLDAQASDTRIQVWPCKSGGICDWRRAPRGQ